MRNSGIIAYGTLEDRQKLAEIAKVLGNSGSVVIIEMIRARYAELFGEDADVG